MKITVEMQGLEQVARELRQRGLDVQAGLETICHAGATVVREAAEEAAQGDIEVEQRTTAKRADRVEVSVQAAKRDKRIARWLEYGTRPHRIPKAGKKRKKRALAFAGVLRAWANHPGAKKRPWLRPAFDANQVKAQAAMAVETKRAVRA